MPARTVVIERLTKMREHGRSGLYVGGVRPDRPGRAGRRGLDSVGHAVVVWSPQVSMSESRHAGHLAAPRPASSFRASYNLAVNLVRRYRGRPGPRHPRPVLRHSSSTRRPSPRPVPAPGPGALRCSSASATSTSTRWRLTARRRPGGRGSTTSPTSSWPRRWPRGSSTDSTRPSSPPWSPRCTFEARAGRRRPEPSPPKRRPPALATPWRSVGERLRATRSTSADLPRTRAPDLGFADVAWRWARGERLDAVLERAELAPGDFVRNAKQLIDLLRQLAVVAPDPDGGFGPACGDRSCSAAWWRPRPARARLHDDLDPTCRCRAPRPPPPGRRSRAP